uniref:Uncharacterized protein n=1 Tax=Lepeophtheirus salmonis TaxID=72036 RepID=A0A0K2UYL1_LEPSM
MQVTTKYIYDFFIIKQTEVFMEEISLSVYVYRNMGIRYHTM